jgi:hypothetical protein
MSTRRRGKIAVGDKIVSRDGVSAKTTGNLQLTGDYEEFGEVQEKRVIEGEGITMHADVFGEYHFARRHGAPARNLVGGSAHNKRAATSRSTASLRTRWSRPRRRGGDDARRELRHLRHPGAHRARVNCEIMAEEVVIGKAEGCAVAARKRDDRIGRAAQAERDAGVRAAARQRPDRRSDRADECARSRSSPQLAAARKAEMEALTGEPEVRKYVMLASKIRKKELTLTRSRCRSSRRWPRRWGRR